MLNMMNVYISGKNPYLGFMDIRPGDVVVLKPNLVKESKENDKDEWKCVVTSPELIRYVAEYICERLQGSGQVFICDAPQTDSSFEKIEKRLCLNIIANDCFQKYKVPVRIIDLRNEEWISEKGIITHKRKLEGDPNGTIAFNLGVNSLFYRHKGEGHYFGADSDYGELNKHHKGKKQEYLLSATPILADVVISLPKMKTHKKTGVTLSLKNLVGITADKNWLPHHTWGSPKVGGDDYPDQTLKRRIETFCSKLVKRVIIRIPYIGIKMAQILRAEGVKVFGATQTTIRSGNWYGNDTTWRMTLDLNRCLIYGNPDGTFRQTKKRYYSVIDGVIAMEGAGPMQGDPKECGVYISGEDPASVDAVATTLMGFDWKKLPVVYEAFSKHTYPISEVNPDDIRIVSELNDWSGSLEELRQKEHFDFIPYFGWKGHLELSNYKKNE